MESLGKICILGGGSFATAIAKLLQMNKLSFNWFIKRDEQIEGFYKLGHNPDYLTHVKFNLAQITFYSNVEKAIKESDTIIIVIPSPYVKSQLKWIWNKSFKGKTVFSAVKGIIPSDNMVISEFMAYNFKIPYDNIGVISGPCHAEEVAMERLSFLTVGCKDNVKARLMAEAITSRILKTRTSSDVVGIELAAVLKNIYAIAAGLCQGLQYGDNFQAVLMTNCAREMEAYLDKVAPLENRNVLEQHYIGDMLVTGYSQFSRNRTLGTMLGKGYSVKTSQLEMEMIAEGYYAAKCIKELNEKFKVETPIADTIYRILYEKASPRVSIEKLIELF